MFTRREFLQTSGAVTLAAAVPNQTTLTGAEPGASPATYKGQPASYWLARLFRDGQDVDHVPRIETRDAVAAFGESVAPALERGLYHDNQSVQFAVIDVLEIMGPVGESLLTAATRHPTGRIRARALGRLAIEFPDAPNLIAMLSSGLDDADSWVRQAAIGALCYARGDTKGILLKALEHADPEVRSSAVGAIERIDPSREFAEPLLIGLLRDPDLEVRWRAVVNLFLNMPVYGGVVPVLLDFIERGRQEAVHYLPHSGEAGLRALLNLLEGSDLSSRIASASSLAEFFCGYDDEPPDRKSQLSCQSFQAVLLACRRAAQDNDLAVSGPVKRVLSVLSSMPSQK
jgi:hypothetical protein